MLKIEIINLISFLTVINLSFFFFFNYLEKIFQIFDYPDKIRKFHVKKISVLGGFLIYFNILTSTIFFFFLGKQDFFFNFLKFKFIIFFIFLSLVFFLGFYDDKYKVAPNNKLIILFLILLSFFLIYPEFLVTSIKFSFSENTFELKNFSIIFTIICFLLFINAFNMLDGINLQTGVYAVINLIYFFTFNKNLFFLTIIFISVLFYLLLNYKNKTFLGDGGAYLLSFIISLFFIRYYNTNYIFADHILIFMIYPGLEIIRLFVLRLKKKKHPFTADRNHLHHYLIEKIGFIKTFLIIQFLIVTPIIFYFYNFKFFAFFFGFITYFFIVFICNLNFKKYFS